jgi:ribose transport system ATP-binding protein
MAEGTAPFWRMKGVSKRYGGVRALDNVDFECVPGRIHAILGENGAGKSTLIKIIAGVVQPDDGQLEFLGQPASFKSPAEATKAGIVCVFQELSLMPDLTVADNICITDPPRKFGLIDYGAQSRRAEELLKRAGCTDVHPDELVKNLPLSRRQMVEIAKALGRKPKMLILDEATSALTAADVSKVYQTLKMLREEGLSILYISHRMHEIAELADDCSVFRNGRHIETFPKGSKTDDQVVELMIGREYKHVFPPKPAASARPCVLQIGTSACMTFRSRSIAARSSALAGSTGRGSGNCCWRCSASCAAAAARLPSTASPSASPARATPSQRMSAWR